MDRAVTIAFFLIALCPNANADTVSWIATGTRIENPAIRSLVLTPNDLDTALSAMVHLARRGDQYVEDIIGPLLDQQSAHHEILLERYLLTVWKSSDAKLQGFVALNPEASERLVRCLPEMDNGYLRGLILLMTRWVEHVDRTSHVVSEASRLALSLETPHPRPDILFAVERLVDTASAIDAPELGSLLLDISRRLRHPTLSKRARQAARSLLLEYDTSD